MRSIVAGLVYVFAGTCSVCTGGLGDGGPATSASIRSPQGLAVDLNGNVYIAETPLNRVRMVNVTSRVIWTVAGLSSSAAGSGGDGGLATLAGLSGMASVVELGMPSEDRMYALIQLCTLSSNYCWAVWAVQQEVFSTIDFDYLAYAQRRLTRYRSEKERVQALLA